MIIVMLGPPGAGKGTQAQKLKEKFSLVHLATGDLLRQAVSDDTPLGRRARSYMEAGKLVPDELVIDLIKEKLADLKDKDILLDGFPRTTAQAEALQAVLKEMGLDIDVVINLTVADELIIKRLSGRRSCRRCGRSYHLEFDPPQQPERCDACGGELYQRDDDTEATITRRLQVYHRQTAPLVQYYQNQGKLRTVAGDDSIDKVADAIAAVITRVGAV